MLRYTLLNRLCKSQPLFSTCMRISCRHTHVVVDRGVSWEEALQLYHQHTSDDELQASGAVQAGSSGREVVRGTSGFYRSKREQYHRYLYLLVLQKDNSTHLYNITRYVYVYAENTCKVMESWTLIVIFQRPRICSDKVSRQTLGMLYI